MTAVLRRLIPWTLLPLAVLATGLGGGLWLRTFPPSVMAGPLFGACVISVLLPVAVTGLFTRRLWVTALLDVAVLVLYLLLVVLRDPTGFGELGSGLVHGPSQLLTYALPLVSPRTLLVAPVVLVWVCGAVAGECLGRDWSTVVPYVAWLAGFALSYAGSVRGVTDPSAGRRQDTLVGAGLLIVLLIIRAAQAWVEQDAGAEDAAVEDPESTNPPRSFVTGVATAVVLAGVAAVIVQASAFTGPPATPQRTPTVTGGEPVTPLAYIADLRASRPDTALFTVRLQGADGAYLPMATLDSYDGDSWSFRRTFRPSGGVIPPETDPALRAGKQVQAQVEALGPALTGIPWMPFLTRPDRVTGVGIDVDPDSGMIVPATPLTSHDTYTIRAVVPQRSFTALSATALPATSAPPVDRTVPIQLHSELGQIAASLASEIGVPITRPVAFLQAVAKDLRAHYSLAEPTSSAPSSVSSSAPSSVSSSPASTTSDAGGERTGGTSFRDVLESILGSGRAGTPEQYATLMALLARHLGVPARVATGFRVEPSTSGARRRVSAADAWSWVEIPVSRTGWAVLDATPSTVAGPRQSPSVGVQPSRSSPSTTSAGNGVITSVETSGNAVAPPGSQPRSRDTATTSVLLVVLALVGVLVLVLVAILLLRKRWRVHRRRRVPDARRSVGGAWQETVDILVEAGLEEPTTWTNTEIADAATERFGARVGGQVASLGATANTAVFGPSTAITAADADAAWSEHWLLRNDLNRTLGVGARLATAARYHRSDDVAAVVGPASWSDVVPPRRRRLRRDRTPAARRH